MPWRLPTTSTECICRIFFLGWCLLASLSPPPPELLLIAGAVLLPGCCAAASAKWRIGPTIALPARPHRRPGGKRQEASGSTIG